MRNSTPAIDRALAMVVYDHGCWLFTGQKAHGGYRMIRPNNRDNHRPVHRIVYEAIVGPIPDGMELDHLCRNTACCNPAHLEPVTPRENTRRGTVAIVASSRPRSIPTHCKHGHEFTPMNTYLYRGSRNCRACKADREKLRTN